MTNNIPAAKALLTDILQKNPNHLLGLIESGINAYNEGDTLKAKEYLTKAEILNAGGSWSETINGYLGRL